MNAAWPPYSASYCTTKVGGGLTDGPTACVAARLRIIAAAAGQCLPSLPLLWKTNLLWLVSCVCLSPPHLPPPLWRLFQLDFLAKPRHRRRRRRHCVCYVTKPQGKVFSIEAVGSLFCLLASPFTADVCCFCFSLAVSHYFFLSFSVWSSASDNEKTKKKEMKIMSDNEVKFRGKWSEL